MQNIEPEVCADAARIVGGILRDDRADLDAAIAAEREALKHGTTSLDDLKQDLGIL